MQANRTATYYESIKAIKNGQYIYPRFADLHTSNRCNQNCKGCAYQSKLDREMMSEEDHFTIIKKLVDFGVKGFDFAGGGEPLSLPYLPKIWDYLKENGCSYGVITNGTLLTEDLIDQIVRQATYIRVSLEASSELEYCYYKQVEKPHWERALSNIALLVAVRNQYQSKCEVAIKYAVGKTLRDSLHYRNGIGLGAMLGVDNVQFKALRHEPEELTLEEKKIEKERLSIASQDYDEGRIRSWIVPADETEVPQCWLNPLHVVVDYKGDVYICCYYYYRGEEHYIGNLLEQDMIDFWMQKDHLNKIRKIDREQCKKVDCKFFRHHTTAEQLLEDERNNFL